MVGGRYFSFKKVYVLYLSVWKFFYSPSVTEARSKRADIDPESKCYLLICDTVVGGLGEHKERLSKYLYLYSFGYNKMAKIKAIEIVVNNW